MTRTRLILDTSAINKLSEDSEFEALLAGVRTSFFVRMTETSIAEVVATTDPDERRRLLLVFNRLIVEGECILPFNLIVEGAAKAFHHKPTDFDWTKLQVRFRSAERVLGRGALVTEELAAQQRGELRKWGREFEDIYKGMRPAFDELFNKAGEARPSLNSLLERFLREGGALWKYGELIYSKVDPSPTEESVRAFYRAFPPFRALMIALCVVHFDRCIRDERQGPSLRAGRIDMFMATYLPYCDVFVSDDERQLRSLEQVAAAIDVDVKIRSYPDFRAGLVGLCGDSIDRPH